MRKFLWVLAVVLIWAAPASAETFRLRDGRTITGKVTQEDSEYITVRNTDDNDEIIFINEIESRGPDEFVPLAPEADAKPAKKITEAAR